MSGSDYKTATMADVCKWLRWDVFTVDVDVDECGGVVVRRNGKKLAQRVNLRRRMTDGDMRVDLRHNNLRKSLHVSQLVWMVYTKCPIPPGFEIHHRNEDRHDNRFENLLCVHSLDHQKLHDGGSAEQVEEIPF